MARCWRAKWVSPRPCRVGGSMPRWDDDLAGPPRASESDIPQRLPVDEQRRRAGGDRVAGHDGSGRDGALGDRTLGDGAGLDGSVDDRTVHDGTIDHVPGGDDVADLGDVIGVLAAKAVVGVLAGSGVPEAPRHGVAGGLEGAEGVVTEGVVTERPTTEAVVTEGPVTERRGVPDRSASLGVRRRTGEAL